MVRLYGSMASPLVMVVVMAFAKVVYNVDIFMYIVAGASGGGREGGGGDYI